MLPILVQKYGGSSLANTACFKRVAAHVAASAQHHAVVVVVSAMGSFTDDTLALAYGLNPSPPKRELDMLLTTGERTSAALLSMALNAVGVDALSLTGSQCGILTDGTHGNARIQSISGERIQDALMNKKIVIVAGFQGVNPQTKEITTLGRGGSDLTAMALAATLQASRCEIYTDVLGIFSANPRWVHEATLCKQMPWDSACHMAWAGAGVMHHRAAEMAKKYRIPYTVRSSMCLSQEGTMIQGDLALESPHVHGLAHKDDQWWIRCHLPHKAIAPCLEALWRLEESPGIYRWQGGRHTQLELILSVGMKEAFEQMIKSFSSEVHLEVEGPLTLITLVGSGFRHAPEIFSKVCAAMAHLPDPPWIEFRDTEVLLVTHTLNTQDMLHALHGAFF